MNNMKINRLKIVNYKLFQNVTIEIVCVNTANTTIQ